MNATTNRELTPAMQQFAQRLKAIIDARGLSHTDVAIGCGYSRPAVSLWIKGKRRPSVDALVRLAAYLRVPPETLWEGKVYGSSVGEGS